MLCFGVESNSTILFVDIGLTCWIDLSSKLKVHASLFLHPFIRAPKIGVTQTHLLFNVHASVLSTIYIFHDSDNINFEQGS